MVRTRLQHVRGGGREPKCGMSSHGVSRALGTWGRKVPGLSGVVSDMDGREFGVSRRFVWVCLILVLVCRCGGDLLGFGSCRVIEDQFECLQTRRWVGVDGVRSGLVSWMQCLWSGCRVHHLVRGDCIYYTFVDLERSLRGVPEF